MEKILLYAFLTMLLTACISWNLSSYYTKKEQVRPIVIQYEHLQIKVYGTLDKMNIPLTDEQKKQFENIVTNYKKPALGFK
jgi:hypothetical protein